MPHLSRYYILYGVARVVHRMRIWPPNATKCYKNAGKFFPNNRADCGNRPNIQLARNRADRSRL